MEVQAPFVSIRFTIIYLIDIIILSNIKAMLLKLGLMAYKTKLLKWNINTLTASYDIAFPSKVPNYELSLRIKISI